MPYPYRLYTALKAPRFMRTLGLSPGLRTVREFIGEPAGRMLRAPVPGSTHTVGVRSASSDRRSYEQVFVGREYALDYGVASPRLIVDAGANCGYAAVYFAQRFPEATVLAIEPEASNLELLRENVAPYPNVRVVEGALWYRHERLSLRNPDADKWSFEMQASSEAEGATGDDPGVQAFTVDDLLQMAGAERVDILKADIEGAEYELLRHAEGWIDRVRALVIELHPHKCPGVHEAYAQATHGRAVRQGRQGENYFALLG